MCLEQEAKATIYLLERWFLRIISTPFLVEEKQLSLRCKYLLFLWLKRGRNNTKVLIGGWLFLRQDLYFARYRWLSTIFIVEKFFTKILHFFDTLFFLKQVASNSELSFGTETHQKLSKNCKILMKNVHTIKIINYQRYRAKYESFFRSWKNKRCPSPIIRQWLSGICDYNSW